MSQIKALIKIIGTRYCTPSYHLFCINCILILSGCDRLEEKLNLNKAEKSRFHLNKCGGIHNRPSPSNISGPRDKVKRFEITKVSL